MSKETEAGCGAVGAPVEPSVRPDSERTNADAPICPWCDQQIWNHCQSQYDTMTCVWRPLEGDDQAWDRNADRITREAFGEDVTRPINPNATSICDL